MINDFEGFIRWWTDSFFKGKYHWVQKLMHFFMNIYREGYVIQSYCWPFLNCKLGKKISIEKMTQIIEAVEDSPLITVPQNPPHVRTKRFITKTNR